MKSKLLAILILCLSYCVSAQDYKTAIGFRGGYASGLTLKHFKSSNVALEGLLQFRYSGFIVTGLYEVHGNAFSTAGLNWYYGGGAHVGFFNDRYYDRFNRYNNGDSYVEVGIDGILGLEYKIPSIPINLSLDYKPAISLIGGFGFIGDGLTAGLFLLLHFLLETDYSYPKGIAV